MWSYMVITHNPQKHFRFKYDPYTGEPNQLCSFLDTNIKRSDIRTRLREDRSIKISNDDETEIIKIIKKALSGNERTSPKTKRMNNNSRIRTVFIKTNKKH